MKQCDASNLWIRLTSTWICVFYVPSVCVRLCVRLLYICTSEWGRKVCTVLEIGRCWRGHAFHSWQVLMLQIYSLQDLLPITTRNNVSPLDWCKKYQRASRRNAIATALQKSLMWWLWNEVSHDYVNAIVSHFCSFSVFFSNLGLISTDLRKRADSSYTKSVLCFVAYNYSCCFV